MSHSESRRRTQHLIARLLPEEKALVVANADRAGLTLADYTRRCVLGRTVVSKDDEALRAELRRLGGLIRMQGLRTHDASIGGEMASTLRTIRGVLKAGFPGR